MCLDIKNINEQADDLDFRDSKCVPATIFEILNENKFKVTFEGKVSTEK
jgi:hypothetical protein